MTDQPLAAAANDKVQCVNVTQGHSFIIHLTTAVFSQQLLPAINDHEKIDKHSYPCRRTFHKGITTTSGTIKVYDTILYWIMYFNSLVEQTQALEGHPL